ncbi:NAD(P)/FAD-dependent oxidoreductase [Terricaulis sp.]|uniref:NAD(P)/FAD-dependent oxidoreductase n=1 Tax=Terricaulis sp. TaxID=2768686 RepID=UPI00378391FE
MRDVDATCGCPIEAARRDELAGLPKVVIVGAGFGGLSAAKALAKAPVHVTLIDRRNHHLFQPLLYQVATAGLAPTQIATPIRAILRKQRNTDVMLATVTGVDTKAKHVLMGERRLRYDYLVLATGARHSYFGRDEWERFAPGLKTLEDATEQRKRILMAFERAELEGDAAERARLTTFVVIGGGPTGVETAGAIAELAKKALAKDYRRINPHCARIILVEAAPRLLGAFPEDLSANARCELERLGVEVRTGAAVTACDAEGVTLGAERIESRCVIWAAGVQASPAAKWLGAKADRVGRTLVGADLRVEGREDVFVIGDVAAAAAPDGRMLPGVAPVAKQQGAYAAAAIGALLKNKQPKPFAYADFGAMATVGRKAAIADFRGLHLRGFFGWFVWSLAHVYFLIGFRNRIAVTMDWIWSYLTFERGARLITGDVGHEAAHSDRKLEAA